MIAASLVQKWPKESQLVVQQYVENQRDTGGKNWKPMQPSLDELLMGRAGPASPDKDNPGGGAGMAPVPPATQAAAAVTGTGEGARPSAVRTSVHMHAWADGWADARARVVCCDAAVLRRSPAISASSPSSSLGWQGGGALAATTPLDFASVGPGGTATAAAAAAGPLGAKVAVSGGGRQRRASTSDVSWWARLRSPRHAQTDFRREGIRLAVGGDSVECCRGFVHQFARATLPCAEAVAAAAAAAAGEGSSRPAGSAGSAAYAMAAAWWSELLGVAAAAAGPSPRAAAGGGAAGSQQAWVAHEGERDSCTREVQVRYIFMSLEASLTEILVRFHALVPWSLS
jgi:hypothetical protein